MVYSMNMLHIDAFPDRAQDKLETQARAYYAPLLLAAYIPLALLLAGTFMAALQPLFPALPPWAANLPVTLWHIGADMARPVLLLFLLLLGAKTAAITYEKAQMREAAGLFDALLHKAIAYFRGLYVIVLQSVKACWICRSRAPPTELFVAPLSHSTARIGGHQAHSRTRRVHRLTARSATAKGDGHAAVALSYSFAAVTA